MLTMQWMIEAAALIGIGAVVGFAFGVPLGIVLEASAPARHPLDGPDCDGEI